MSPLTEAEHPFKSATVKVTAGGKSFHLHVVIYRVNLFVQAAWQLSSLLTFFIFF